MADYPREYLENLRTKSGRITAYAMACGYYESVGNYSYWGRLNKPENCVKYRVRFYSWADHNSLADVYFNTLKAARKEFDRLSKLYQEEFR